MMMMMIETVTETGLPRPQQHRQDPRLQLQLQRYPISIYNNTMRRSLLIFFSDRIESLVLISTSLFAILVILSIPDSVNATSSIEGLIDCYDDPTSAIISCVDDPDTNTNLNDGIIDAEIPSIVGTIPFP